MITYDRRGFGRSSKPAVGYNYDTFIHGDDDRILPADVTARRQVKLIKGAELIEIKGGSHGIPWTHAQEINDELVKFLS